MEQQIRILAATILSISIILGWQYFFAPQYREQTSQTQKVSEVVEKKNKVEYVEYQDVFKEREHSDTRVLFGNEYVTGSVNLIGAQIDDIELLKYKKQLDSKDNVVLLSPQSTKDPYFVNFNWKILSNNADVKNKIELPDQKTLWNADSKTFDPNNPLIMTWHSSQRVVFTITVSLDEQYMLDVKTDANFENASDEIKELIQQDIVKIRGQILVSRGRNSLTSDSSILHEGGISVIDDKLKEISFSDLQEEKHNITKEQKLDWLGFSDKYWLVSIIPQYESKTSNATAKFYTNFSKKLQQIRYNIDFNFEPKKITPTNSKVSNHMKLFVGAKSLEILDDYESKYNIQMFDHAVDFGVLYFITKPIFLLLTYFYKIIGNFGLSIILLTLLTKIALFPLAYKSIKSMNAIKRLQPQINRLRDRYGSTGNDFQTALVKLYEKENVNPITGCLPLVLQMPVFFALYKVLYVTIEMRHAPFFLWIHDLSAPDTTTIFNLFGLIPWQPPLFLMIGVLPIAMSFTMFLQQSLSPQPADATQATVMRLMPLLLLFMFSQFPSGLLLYWTCSNIISILQQVLIKRISPN